MAGNPLASLPGLPQRPSLARSSASETRLTQPGIEAARSRKLNSAPTAAFRFIASPLLRTRETMDLARTAMGLAPRRYRLDPTLVELSFGDWEGLTWPEIEARDPAGAAEREADRWNFVPPNGQSYAMLCDRLRPWLAARSGDVFVASHGGVARAFLALIAGVKPGIAAGISIWQGRAIVFEKGGYRWVG